MSVILRNRIAAVSKSLRNTQIQSAPVSFKEQAATAFESDMQPVCNAIVGALNANDMDALKGLRALLPHLLEEVNQAPALADVLAHQLGKSLLDGLNAKPEDTL